jgi:hypothetical protein
MNDENRSLIHFPEQRRPRAARIVMRFEPAMPGAVDLRSKPTTTGNVRRRAPDLQRRSMGIQS